MWPYLRDLNRRTEPFHRAHNDKKEEGPRAPSVTCKKIETNMAVDHVERKTDA